MKKTFTINDHEVEFTACTAIAASIGDTERQKAVFVHIVDDEFHNGDGVLFGVDVPDDDQEAVSILREYLDTDFETLSTVVPSGLTLKELRLERGLTQQELADKSGINVRQVQKYESGEYLLENMTAKSFLALSDALAIDPYALLMEENK